MKTRTTMSIIDLSQNKTKFMNKKYPGFGKLSTPMKPLLS